MIGILDYGMGNLGSVQNTCAALNIEARLVTTAAELEQLDGLIVPGQGAFRDCMAHLQEHGFVAPLREWIVENRPFFGICMGLQLLFDASEESPGVTGLGVLPGTVRRFEADDTRKVPQMGWNRVEWMLKDDPVFTSDLNGRHFYFVHSYHIPDTDLPWAAGKSDYGHPYVSAVRKGRCYAVQFHPEKSQKDGLQLIKNFADFVDSGNASS